MVSVVSRYMYTKCWRKPKKSNEQTALVTKYYLRKDSSLVDTFDNFHIDWQKLMLFETFHCAGFFLFELLSLVTGM